MEKTKRNRADTTQRIINALEQVLTEAGLEGVSINIIAEKAEVSKVLIYRYFGSLEGLLEYYVQSGRIIPHYSPVWIEQIRPTQLRDLASIWSGQALQLFRQFRVSRSARQLLKATVRENDTLADRVSKTLDAEMADLVKQLSFVHGVDYQAISAIVLGGLSYLTLQAQIDRPMIGLDLRSEEDWQRVEKAVSVMYKALNQFVVDSASTKLDLKPSSVEVDAW